MLALVLALGNAIFWIPAQSTQAEGEPVAIDDTGTTDENNQLSAGAPGVLSNDSGSGLSVTAVNGSSGNVGSLITLTSGALLTLNSNGSYIYNPNGKFESLDAGGNTTDQFQYTVSNGTGSDTATVTITITGVNDPPIVEATTLDIDENSPNGAIVGTVPFSDSEGNITGFTINPSTVFSIDNDCQITVAASSQLDYETTTQYTVVVEATDDGALTDNATITIDVNDINDNPPLITNPEPISFNIPENSADGTVTGAITATDPENNITGFNITGGDPAGTFSIGDVDGQITVAHSNQLDFETVPQYNLTVEVVDEGELTDTANVTISVTNVNDPPVADDGTASATEDGEPVSTQVPAAHDDDNNLDPNGYVLVDDLTPEGNLTFNANGSYTFAPGANFQDLGQGESRNETFTYTARDTEGAVSETATVTITIAGVNDLPTDITLDNNSVAEHKDSGTTVGTFSTTDADTEDTHTYTLVSGTGSAGNGLFAILGNELKTNTVFDFESTPTHSIRVRTADAGASYEKVFTINIIDGNDPPTSITLSGNLIAENSPNDTVVGTLAATDPNSTDTHTFSIISQNHDGAFTISSNEIRVGDSSKLDYEADDEHGLYIEVMDSGGLNYRKSIFIEITDVNEPPAPLADSYSVVRGNTLNIPASGVLGNDADPEGTVLSGTIVSNPAHASAFTFNDDGSFSYTNDGTSSITDNFTYKAYDGTLYSHIVTVTITITTPNPPTVTTPTATSFTKTSATLGANITSDGGAAITKKGVVWSTSAAPTLATCSGSKSATGTTTGIFTVPVSGLTAGTKYYCRGFATNSAGTSYTEDKAFETNPELSNIIIASTVNEGSNATLSGNITAASGTKLTIDWGDGSNTSDENPGASFSKSHIYSDGSKSGTIYTITLTLTLDSDATRKDTVTKSVPVKNVSPTAQLSVSSNPVDEGKNLILTIGTPTDPGNDTITKYTVWWDNTTSNIYSPGKSMTHIYTDAANSVFIRVYITDEDGDHQIENVLTLKVSNVEPTAKKDSYTTYANSPLHKYKSEGLLINDENPAKEPVSIISVDDSATDGEVTWEEDGSFTYDPNGAYDWLKEGETRTDTFAYTIEDDDGSTDEAIVTITIKGYSQKPCETPGPSIYFLNALTIPSKGGLISMNPAGGSYVEGTNVTLTASPARGYKFTGWSGDLSGAANPKTVTVDGNINAIANFSAATATPVVTGTPTTPTPTAGTPTQTGTPSEEGNGGGFNPWVIIGPILGVGAIVAIARVERMGGFSKLRKSWTRMKGRGS